MTEYKYLFSIIVPLYNTGDYIEECIKSIIDQTIGFDKIQLILISDNSPNYRDEEISFKYKIKYPNNIVYDKLKQSRGASSTRNLGYKYIEGKYVSFLDGDDKYSLDALEKAYNYFELEQDNINIVITSSETFEAEEGIFFRYKNFDETSIVYVSNAEKNRHQVWITNCFYKQDLIKKYYLDSNIKASGSDFKLINTILLNEGRFGYFPIVKYFYRIRIKENSGMNVLFKNEEDYIYKTMLKEIYRYICELSIKIYGYVIPFISGVNVQHIYYLCIRNSLYFLDLEEKYKKIFYDDLVEILSFIDDEVIISEGENLSDDKKLQSISLLMQIKYERNLQNMDIKFLEEKRILPNDEKEISKYIKLILNEPKFITKSEQDILIIEGYFLTLPCYNINKIYLEIDGEYFLAKINNIEKLDKILEMETWTKYYFNINLEHIKCIGKCINIYLDVNGIFIFCPPVLKF